MNRKQAIPFAFLLFFIVGTGKAQVDFSIVIKNYADSSVLLTSYYGNKIKLIDTVYKNEGVFSFNEKNYPPGIYILADPAKNRLFEFIINNESDFNFYVELLTSGDIIANSSKENELFFKHLQLKKQLYEEANRISKNQSNNEVTFLTSEIDQKLDSLQNLLKKEEFYIINDYPELFISKLISAQQEIDIPQSIIQDTIQKYMYQKNHFWDRMDLSDERFLRTPLLDKMINTYFDHFILLHPDSTIAAIDTIISKARPSKEMVSYLLWYFISEYQNPEYMGFDKVFVHLVDNYFLKEEIANASPSVLEKLWERSNKLKPLLIGESAPNLILIDTNERFTSFYNLETDFSLLFFWDYNCDVCDKEMEELSEIIRVSNYDIGIYAVNTNKDLNKWKQIIRDRKMDWLHVNGTKGVTEDYHELYDINGTPRLFLLDNEKKIIAKHFKVAQLIAIIENQFMKSK